MMTMTVGIDDGGDDDDVILCPNKATNCYLV